MQNWIPVPNGALTTITGVVVPMEEDSDGNPTLVALSVSVGVEEVVEAEEYAFEDITEEYFVASTEKGYRLLKLKDETVEVTGVVAVDEDGNKTIFVKRYRVID